MSQNGEQEMTTILILPCSLYGPIYRMAQAVERGGGGGFPDVNPCSAGSPGMLLPEVLAKMGAMPFQEEFSRVPVCTREELASADAVIIGTPTRFGNLCG
ncbi:MAG: hypothetical protein WC382_00665 [Methanoregulaceae archaeon]|jgi:NAD(P)H dehydrogenase (quinone)